MEKLPKWFLEICEDTKFLNENNPHKFWAVLEEVCRQSNGTYKMNRDSVLIIMYTCTWMIKAQEKLLGSNS